MWSFGVILFVMIAGHQPFKGRDQSHVFENISEVTIKSFLINKNVHKLQNLIKKIGC